jgi:signal transduction histidine kinase
MFGALNKKLTFWFPTVPKKDQEGLDKARVHANLLRQRILVWVFVAGHLALTGQHVFRTGDMGPPYMTSFRFLTLAICISFLLAAGKPASPDKIRNRHHLCALAVFVCLSVSSALQLSLLGIHNASASPYAVAVLLMAGFFYLSGPKMFALFALAWSLWLAVVWRVSTDLHVFGDMIVTGSIPPIMAIMIARVTYVSWVRAFLDNRIIERQREQQNELRALNEITARLAHEIRNPLTSAGGFARRLLASMGPDDPNRKKAEVVVHELGRLETILRRILNYLKPLELHRSQTDPDQLVRMVLEAMGNDIKERGVHLKMQLESGLRQISADRARLEQLVKVLVKNALNCMDKDSTLSVFTCQENNYFFLVMQYPVPHLSADDVEDFFFPFTMHRTSHDKAFDTTDLSVCKILAEKHGGGISVRKDDGCGLVIEMYLPVDFSL